MSHYFIVGKSFGPLEESITANGDSYTVLADKNAYDTGNEGCSIDFSSKDAILAGLKDIPKKPDGILTVYENYVLAAAYISEVLGLPGLSIDAAKACTDKSVMRKKFSQAPENISPDFAEISSLNDAINFASQHAFPLILKPANLAKSLLVIKCSDASQLRKNYQYIHSQIDAVYKKYAPNSVPKLIIEEYMEGSVHSLDAFADDEGNVHLLDDIVDYQTGYDIGYEDNFHYSRILPSKLSVKNQASIKHVAKLGMKALGMKNSPAHIELILTATGPKIVEIGARNGGYRSRMHLLANDIDLHKAHISIAKGEIPKLTKKKNEYCAVIELFPRTNGRFKHIHAEAKLRNLDSLKYVSIKAKQGEFVGKSSDGYKMCAVIILHHENKSTFEADLEFVNDSVYVETSESK